MNPNEIEKKKIVQEWFDKAKADLESAEILLKESKNYDIVAYHSHQAIEKFFKGTLLQNDQTFKFSHDLNALFDEVCNLLKITDLEKDLSYVNSLYPRLRYPTGDLVTAEAAEKCLAIAKKIVKH
ncbi:MAG: HEPN domain-containing protein [bacterium]